MATTNDTETALPRITFYTSHSCPFAHRAHIAIKELRLPYEEVLIDLGKPREEWYLKINPVGVAGLGTARKRPIVPAEKRKDLAADRCQPCQRGLVPSLNYNGEIITESAVVTQFLADAHPSHLVPASNAPGGALRRARIAFFVDAWSTKVQTNVYGLMRHADPSTAEEKTAELVAAIGKEIEPLLEDAKPYFGGSDKVTLVEALVASFVIRLYAFGRGGMLPESLLGRLDALPNFSRWARTLEKTESVTYVWDEKKNNEGMRAMMEKMRNAKA